MVGSAGVADYLPAVCGYLVQKEVSIMGKALSDPERPFVAIVGGSHEDDASIVLDEVVDGGQGSLDAGGVANDAILDRHVEVNADENALAVDIDVADGLLGKGHVCFYLSYVSASHYGRRFLIKRARP